MQGMVCADLAFARQIKPAIQIGAPIEWLAKVKLLRVKRSQRQVKIAEVIGGIDLAEEDWPSEG